MNKLESTTQELQLQQQVQQQAILTTLALKSLQSASLGLPVRMLRALVLPIDQSATQLPISYTISSRIKDAYNSCQTQEDAKRAHVTLVAVFGDYVSNLINAHIDGVSVIKTDNKGAKIALFALYSSYGQLLIDFYGNLTFEDLTFAFELYASGKLHVKLNTYQGKFTPKSLGLILNAYLGIREKALSRVRQERARLQQKAKSAQTVVCLNPAKVKSP